MEEFLARDLARHASGQTFRCRMDFDLAAAYPLESRLIGVGIKKLMATIDEIVEINNGARFHNVDLHIHSYGG